jgi:circadian clock protein KaiC
MTGKVTLGQLATGVPGLDVLLGGGLPEFSFNLIAGAPGSGKTTLAHQMMFALANPQRKAIFFTVLGEPPMKMLRYQQQYSFFDIAKLGDSILYINLADSLRTGDFTGVLERIMKEVEAYSPGLVFVDSFRSVVQTGRNGNEGIADLQYFVQELGTRMTSWQATTFLIGEYIHAETEANPILTVADGLISLSQNLDQNSVVRKLRIVKMRGQPHLAGMHTFRIGSDGIRIYPRLLPPLAPDLAGSGSLETDAPRVPFGIAGLDEMLCGGLPAGHSVLLSGPSGAGKSIMGTAFLSEGARRGEKGVLASFEKGTSRMRNVRMAELVQAGHVSVVETRSLDLSIEEILDQMLQTIDRTQARRVVIDSLSELWLYLAPEFRHDVRESVFRMFSALAKTGVTMVVTTGLDDRFNSLSFSHFENAFLADAIIALRYVETKSRLSKLMSVVKVRGSDHSRDLRQYEITDQGIELGEKMSGYEGLLSAHPTAVSPMPGQA